MLNQSVTKSNCTGIQAINERLSCPATIEPADMSDLRLYGNRHRIVEATADDSEVVITWEDGHVSRFHYGWLRENCPHPSSRHVRARERIVRPLSIPESIRPLEIAIDGSGALLVTWDEADKSDSAAHHQSRFHPGWLRAHCYTYTPAPPSSAENVATIQPAYLTMPDASWDELIGSDEAFYYKRIGVVRASNFGYIFDVQSKADPNSNAYTSFYLPFIRICRTMNCRLVFSSSIAW
ncbi:gamma-butyrobetaine hydroxylase-like domain-containing protein [Nguyenibacter sp. L1]|uniref:gamma-butyrobetaine hydroxylase-like domain-containing protein n=1 Tax=Nguyenibacter sp. L1 TaxID=3049350 RepID=UPI002B4780D1|nr:gamma-butyrobetaine hydroxylase-like domain-containing protein [Nguyenibacter sp. L1]WRH89027.1 gamma-butyrobetaine hydroxylase-like domain-containing protein [Nguyenibacter sp. L1]